MLTHGPGRGRPDGVTEWGTEGQAGAPYTAAGRLIDGGIGNGLAPGLASPPSWQPG
jgi:hypothetical protein